MPVASAGSSLSVSLLSEAHTLTFSGLAVQNPNDPSAGGPAGGDNPRSVVENILQQAMK